MISKRYRVLLGALLTATALTGGAAASLKRRCGMRTSSRKQREP
jgi:hypothetical protein